MADVNNIILKAIDKSGFVRTRYNEDKIPTNLESVTVLPFFPNHKHLFVASSLLLKRYKEEKRSSKYLILASYAGNECLFPFVDEYWGIKDDSITRTIYKEANHFDNKSEIVTNCYRNLNDFFFDVSRPDFLSKYYNNGLTNQFLEEFPRITRTLPLVPSVGVLSKELNREMANKAGFKVVIMPAYWSKTWRNGKEHLVDIPKSFYVALAKRLIKDNFVPIMLKTNICHNIAEEAEGIHVNEGDMSKILGIMRGVGCVVDIFGDSSYLSLAARCPFVKCVERSVYVNTKEWEINDLCGEKIPKQYIFSFSDIISDGNEEIWNSTLFSSLSNKLKEFLPGLNRDALPSTIDSTETVSYKNVRELKTKKIGAKLLKIPKE